jgi:hypothetical protein
LLWWWWVFCTFEASFFNKLQKKGDNAAAPELCSGTEIVTEEPA